MTSCSSSTTWFSFILEMFSFSFFFFLKFICQGPASGNCWRRRSHSLEVKGPFLGNSCGCVCGWGLSSVLAVDCWLLRLCVGQTDSEKERERARAQAQAFLAQGLPFSLGEVRHICVFESKHWLPFEKHRYLETYLLLHLVHAKKKKKSHKWYRCNKTLHEHFWTPFSSSG